MEMLNVPMTLSSRLPAVFLPGDMMILPALWSLVFVEMWSTGIEA
jgi:hypothetical protein